MPDFDIINGIPDLTEEPACTTVSDTLKQKERMLKDILDRAKGSALEEAKRKLFDVTGLGDDGLSDTQGAMDEATGQANAAGDASKSMMDQILDGEVLEGSNVSLKNLAACLGGLGDFGFPDVDNPFDLSQLKKLGEKLMKAIMDLINNILDALLDPLEKALMDALAWLKDLLPLDLIDEILNLINCLQGCPNVDQSKLPTVVDIEEKVKEAGLKITGELDFEEGPLSEVANVTPKMKESFGDLVEGKKALEGKIGGISDVDKLPSIPDIPSIPRSPNPLKGFSLMDKVEALF